MARRLWGGGILVVALCAASCLVGARPQRAAPEPQLPSCPPRWAADSDPQSSLVAEAVARLEATLPEGSRALLPGRGVRLGPACSLRLPLRLEQGRCYLLAAKIFPRTGPPRATLRFPDPLTDQPREYELDHSMMATFGEGADPVCFDDGFDAVVEVEVFGEGDLIWLQAFEVSSEAAAGWAERRRAQLLEAAMAVEVNRAPPPPPPAPEPCVEAAPDARPEEALVDGGCLPSGDADLDGETEGGAEGGVAAEGGVDVGVDGGGSSQTSPAVELAQAEEALELGTLPEGPLAVELAEQCQDGLDNDQDGAADCADPECESLCQGGRLDRVPWPRVLDLRLAGAFRFAYPGVVASGAYDPGYLPLEARWGLTTQASAVYRPSRYLGVGLDLGLAHLQSSSYISDGSLGARNRVAVLSLSLGLSVQVSIPLWIMEIGGSVGIGWLHLRATAEEQSLSGADTTWHDNDEWTLSFDAPYGSGWLWVDFWLVDGVALGLYGGVLAPLTQPHEGLLSNDYHVGLRFTLRLGL